MGGMIKFRIYPKFKMGKVQIWESVAKMSKSWVFDIFWGIFNKMKYNLGQKCVNRAKMERLPLISLENESFLVLILFLRLSLPKIWSSHPNKYYIFE